MAFGDVLLVAEDCDIASYEAVCDTPAAVDVGSFHDDCVFDLCIEHGDVVSDACVGADVGVGAYVAVVSDDGRTSDCCAAVNGSVVPYGDIVC